MRSFGGRPFLPYRSFEKQDIYFQPGRRKSKGVLPDTGRIRPRHGARQKATVPARRSNAPRTFFTVQGGLAAQRRRSGQSGSPCFLLCGTTKAGRQNGPLRTKARRRRRKERSCRTFAVRRCPTRPKQKVPAIWPGPFVLVPPGGIEPPTRGFSVPCSTD